MMRAPITGLVALLAFTVTAHAAAEGSRPKKTKPKKAVPETVATAPDLPPLPPPSPKLEAAEKVTPATTAAAAETPPLPSPKPNEDKAAAAPSVVDRDAGAGFVLTFGSGPNYIGGKIADGMDIGSVQMTFELRMGAYITRHFGVIGGVQGGYGKLLEGCAGDCTNALSYQLPVVAQYSFQDRRRGPYAEGGVAILSTVLASTGDDSKTKSSPETLEVRSPVDVKLGFGFRFAPVDPKEKKDTTSGYDVRLGVDLGQYSALEYGNRAGDVKGDIHESKQALHYGVALFFGYHFTP